MLRLLATMALAFAAASIAAAASEAPLGTPAPVLSGPVLSGSAGRGLAFAQQHCASCHAVTANGTSPNPDSPPFEDIANRDGVTVKTLRLFLRDSHNFPAAMNFTVEAGQLNNLAKYIVTMQKPGYRPQI